MFATCILFHLKCLYCLWCAISFTQNVRNAPDTFILYCTLHFTITITYCSYIYNEVLSCIFKYKKKNRNIINSCYYGEMPNVTKKNHIIIKSILVWRWNHLFTKNYFGKKKNYVMDSCLATLRSFVVQWSTKITGHRPQLKPLPITHCGVNMFGPFTVK